jgi:hypothetical protein
MLNFEFHGVPVEILSGPPEVLSRLELDFQYFRTEPTPTGPEPIRLTLELGPPNADMNTPGFPVFRTREYATFGLGSPRRVVYGDGALALYDARANECRIRSLSVERLHELAYLAILSRVGDALDRRGLHRIHALGFSWKGSAALLLLPSGGGKSVLALELLKRTEARLFADDAPLISPDLKLVPFPIRLSFRDSASLDGVPQRFVRPFQRRRFGSRRLIDLGYFAERVAAEAPLRWILIGSRRAGARAAVSNVSRAGALRALGLHLVVGHGLPQLAEFTLRFGAADLRDLASIAMTRGRTACRLLSTVRCRRFALGDDVAANVETLAGFLEADSRAAIE